MYRDVDGKIVDSCLIVGCATKREEPFTIKSIYEEVKELYGIDSKTFIKEVIEEAAEYEVFGSNGVTYWVNG